MTLLEEHLSAAATARREFLGQIVGSAIVLAGAACGLCMGLMLLTKTLGVLIAPALVIAWLVGCNAPAILYLFLKPQKRDGLA